MKVFVIIRLGKIELINRLLIEIFNWFVNIIKIILGGIIWFRVFDVIIIFVVNFLLYLYCNIIGKEINFIVIIVVVIILVVVVRRVFIRIMVRVKLFLIWLNNIFIVFNSCFVMLDFFNIVFIKIK